MANGHGGARRGAGRPRKATIYAPHRASTNDQIAAGLPDRVAALEILAEGGYEQIEEEWVPAGLVFVDDIKVSSDGKASRTRVRAFPDLKADELVCIKRKRSIAAPDRAANIYLIDRILGKPGSEGDDEDDDAGDTAQTPEELLELWNTSSDSSSDTSPTSSTPS